MFDFEPINIDNRSRHLVRGRVIGFTDSTNIEFINPDLTRSIVLFSTWSFQPGYGVSFCLELYGYLTFKPGTEVRIEELAPYKSPHCSAASFFLTKPADPFRSVVTGGYLASYPNGFGAGLANFTLYHSTEHDGDEQVDLVNVYELEQDAGKASEFLKLCFPIGSRYNPKDFGPNFRMSFVGPRF